MKKKYHRNKKVNMPNFSNMQNHIYIYMGNVSRKL